MNLIRNILLLISIFFIQTTSFGQNTLYPQSIDTIKCPTIDYRTFQTDYNIEKYKLKCWNEYYKGAIFYFTKLIATTHAPDSAYLYRAIARINLKNILENMYSIEDLNIELSLRPKNYMAFYYRAIAKKQLRQTEILTSQNTQTSVDLNSYEYPEAIIDLNEAIRLNPDFEPALNEKKKLVKK